MCNAFLVISCVHFCRLIFCTNFGNSTTTWWLDGVDFPRRWCKRRKYFTQFFWWNHRNTNRNNFGYILHLSRLGDLIKIIINIFFSLNKRFHQVNTHLYKTFIGTKMFCQLKAQWMLSFFFCFSNTTQLLPPINDVCTRAPEE